MRFNLNELPQRYHHMTLLEIVSECDKLRTALEDIEQMVTSTGPPTLAAANRMLNTVNDIVAAALTKPK